MHVDEVLRSRRLVQAVDVLRNDGDGAIVLAVQTRQREMRRIRLHAGMPAPAVIVEVVHELRVAPEAFGRRHLTVVVLRPDAVLVAKRGDAGLRGEPGTGEHDDVAIGRHRRSDSAGPARTQRARRCEC